jgi:hypothetical protein
MNLTVEEGIAQLVVDGAHVIEVTDPGVELHTVAAETGKFPAVRDAPIRVGTHLL